MGFPKGTRSKLPIRLAAALGVLLPILPPGPLSAATLTDWESRQELMIGAPGLQKVSLPAVTLGSARPGLEDLRLVSPAGQEMPYLVERSQDARPQWTAPRSIEVFVESERTRIVVRRDAGSRLSGVLLETTSPQFLKAVTVREGVEADRGRMLAENQPVFRQRDGATRLVLGWPETAARELTLLLNDQRTPPIPIDGLRLQELADRPPAAEAVSVTVRQQLESPGETRLVLDLEAANLTLANLDLQTPEPLFTRPVALLTREVEGGEIREHVLKQGTIYRVAVERGEPVTQLELPLDVQVVAREVVLRIENGDSQPLKVEGVQGTRRPVFLVFQASEPGRYQVLTGNRLAPAPRYDLAALAQRLRNLEPTGARLGPIEPNPDYRPTALLPTVPLLAGELDVAPWAFRRRVFGGAGSGVQEIELDPDVLARSSRHLADLRLVSDGRQVPYVLERTSMQRTVPLTAKAEPDPKRPTVSRWALQLPEKSLPIARLACEVSTTLFDRQISLIEEMPDDRGRSQRRVLASTSWRRTPERAGNRLWIDLPQPPQGDTLILETDNGDNPAINLEGCQALYPATRILFRLPAETPVDLYYGNPQAASPSYDLALLASQILASRRLPAELGVREQLSSAPWLEPGATTRMGTVLFWGVLALVVIGLVFVMVRMLPAAVPPNEP